MQLYVWVETDRPLRGVKNARLLAQSGRVVSSKKPMFDNDNSDNESIELEPRTRRALEESMSVLTPDFFPVTDKTRSVLSVTTGSGSTYHVDVREGRCTCPDQEHRNPEGGCKHLRRARIATGRTPVPAGVFGSVDIADDFGANVDASAKIATADGGIVNAGDDDGRPDECDCLPSFDELPCWPCYRDGFDDPEE